MSYKEKAIYAFTNIVSGRKSLAEVAFFLEMPTDEVLQMHQTLLKMHVDNRDTSKFPTNLINDF